MPETETENQTPAANPDLRDKVESAKARLADRTANPRPVETVKTLIVEHPVASVAAGILLGALIARALPKSGPSSTRLRKSAAGLATVAGKYAVDYAMKAADAGRDGLHKVEEAGSKIAESSSDARRKANDLADIARAAAIEASEIAIRKMTELASRIKP